MLYYILQFYRYIIFLFVVCLEVVNKNVFGLSLSIRMSHFLSLPWLTDPHHIPSHLTTPLSLNDIPPRIAQTMENEDSWDFDIFNLEAATMKRWDSASAKRNVPKNFFSLEGECAKCVKLPCCILLQAFDLLGPEDLLPLWGLWVPKLSRGHTALLATSDWS